MDTRYKIVLFLMGFVLFAIALRLYFLSVISYENYSSLATQNIMRTEILTPSRGQILDRSNRPLAANDLGYSISLNPYLGKKANIPILEGELEDIVRMFPYLNLEELKSEYMKNYSSYNHSYITVVPFISYDDMNRAYTALTQSDNIRISNASKRYYPNDSLASHVIGYIGAATKEDIENNTTAKYTGLTGKTGLENYYNDFLQGELGYIKTKVNVLNRPVELLDEMKANKRYDMVLGIDIDLQKELDREFESKAGSAIVMDVNSGEILAAGSYPEYNLNDFIGGISESKWNELINNIDNPFINKIINGMYPPGSVIKMGVGMSFLEFGDINEYTVIDTPPYYEFGGRKFRDWTPKGHTNADLIKALRRSVDVYFYKLSHKIGIENMASTLKTMGFGEITGIDLPNESRGILPTPSWKLGNRGEPWFIGDTIISSIGQGLFLSTPIQIARYTSLLATSKLPTPHFVKKLGDKMSSFPPKDVLSDFQKSKLQAIRLGMYQACNSVDGTAYSAVLGSPVKLACKTGTAQVVGIPQDIKDRIREKDMEYLHRSHSWITAFLPFKNPKYAVTIIVEHGGSASKATGPILVAIAKKLHALGYID